MINVSFYYLLGGVDPELYYSNISDNPLLYKYLYCG